MGAPHLSLWCPCPNCWRTRRAFVSFSACELLSKMKQEADGSAGFIRLASRQLYLLSVPGNFR